MPMTVPQLQALLETMAEPARVYDASGAVVAQNQAAHGVRWSHDSDGGGSTQQVHDLGQGWRLCKMKTGAGTGVVLNGVSQLSAKPAAEINIHELLRGLMHELRNRIAPIVTAISLVRDDDNLTEETSMLLGIVRKECYRMNRSIDEFSLYVKPPRPHPTVFCIAEAARATLDELRRDGILNAKVTVTDALPEHLMVCADEAQMRFVLRHILKNAADAMSRGGALELSGWETAPATGAAVAQTSKANRGQVVLCISDSGSGFSSDDLQDAFLPFHSSKPQSTGLGLAAARSAVSAANGRIWIENLGLPAPRKAVPKAPRNSSTSTLPPLHGARVCIELPSAPTTV